MLIKTSFRFVVYLVLPLILIGICFFYVDNIYCIEDGFVIIRPGQVPQFGDVDQELVDYLRNNLDYSQGKLQIKILINRDNPEENNPEYIAKLKAKIIEAFKGIERYEGISINTERFFNKAYVNTSRKVSGILNRLHLKKTESTAKLKDLYGVEVEFVVFTPTQEQKIEEVREVQEQKIQEDPKVKEIVDIFLEELSQKSSEFSSVDPDIVSKIVSIHNIVEEEMVRISQDQPTLFEKKTLDAVSQADVDEFLSRLSKDKKRQVISMFASVMEENPEKFAAILGISDPSIINKSFIKMFCEAGFKFFATMKYIFGTLKRTLRVPIKDLKLSEMGQGIAPKIIPYIQSTVVAFESLGAKPTYFIAAISYSFLLDNFHGIEASGWMDFLNRMTKERGERFVAFFNAAYTLYNQLVFRLIALAAGKIHPFIAWDDGFINKDWLLLTFITVFGGSFVSAEANKALNAMHYERLSMPKRARDIIQQYVRDIPMLLTGALLGMGGEHSPFLYWVFATGLVLDGIIIYTAKRLTQRSALYIGNKDTLAHPQLGGIFSNLMDHTKVVEQEPSSVQALKETMMVYWRAVVATFLVIPKTVLGVGRIVKTGCMSMFSDNNFDLKAE